LNYVVTAARFVLCTKSDAVFFSILDVLVHLPVESVFCAFILYFLVTYILSEL